MHGCATHHIRGSISTATRCGLLMTQARHQSCNCCDSQRTCLPLALRLPAVGILTASWSHRCASHLAVYRCLQGTRGTHAHRRHATNMTYAQLGAAFRLAGSKKAYCVPAAGPESTRQKQGRLRERFQILRGAVNPVAWCGQPGCDILHDASMPHSHSYKK